MPRFTSEGDPHHRRDLPGAVRGNGNRDPGYVTADWVVNGTDLGSPTLQAGQGYNSRTNTTTATLIIPAGSHAGFLLSFTNTDRSPGTSQTISGISHLSGQVTVDVSSVTGIAAEPRRYYRGFHR